MRSIFIMLISVFSFVTINGQVLTREDSLSAGLIASEHATLISGYGEAKVGYDLKSNTAEANLTRNVIFLGHKFNSKISLFSEWEIEDAKVEGGEPGGEIAIEQLFIKFNLSRDIYLNAGLFIPRIGIINENHLPTTFNGVDRPFVETFVIPATWREIGIGIFGQTPRLQGFNYSLCLMNGLNSEGFGGEKGIREGRYEGREASARNMALTGSVLYYMNSFRFQISGYYGGTVGLSPADADSLKLNDGAFGTPDILGEASIQYAGKGLSGRILGTVIAIPDAAKLNDAYGNNAANQMWGGYAELGFNILSLCNNSTSSLTLFSRYEMFDLNAQMPANGIKDGLLNQQYFVVGISYLPISGVAIKADFVQRTTGTPDPTLHVFAPGEQYFASRGFVNLGIAYSF